MEINGTLLIQAVHFFCAYWLLRTLLFDPALAILFQEQEEQFAAHRALQEQEQQLEHERNRVDAAWRQCQLYFSEHSPKKRDDNVAFFRNIAPNIAQPAIDQEYAEKEAKKVAQAIVKKVGHVHT